MTRLTSIQNFLSLIDKNSFEEETRSLKIIPTHISYVFLTDKFAYKVKKPVNFGFLNYSTLSLRKKYCEAEIKKNKVLAPELYIKVLPVGVLKNKKIKFGSRKKIIDYAVKMVKLKEKEKMDHLLKKQKIRKQHLDRLANTLARFHINLKPVSTKSAQKSFTNLKFFVHQNFNQTKPFVDRTIDLNKWKFIKQKSEEFLNRKKSLFQERIRANKIKDIHGDVHSENIFIKNHQSSDFEIIVFDAIEFNKNLSIQDYILEVASLSMDLELRGGKVLSSYFLNSYFKYNPDKDIKSPLLRFYQCYSSFVRGKVKAFKVNDFAINYKLRKQALKISKKYFNLSYKYAKLL